MEERLLAIEHKLKFFADSYTQLHNQIIRGMIFKIDDTPLKESYRELSQTSSNLKEFSKNVDIRYLINSLEKISKEIRSESIIGTLAFMAKKIHEMELTISKLHEEGIKKKIHMDFTVDGYEMVKRKIKDINEPEVDEEPEEILKSLLNTLLAKEQIILIHRYGLFGIKQKTLAETGKELGFNQEVVRQVQSKALRKLRFPSRKDLVQKLTHKKLKKDITGED